MQQEIQSRIHECTNHDDNTQIKGCRNTLLGQNLAAQILEDENSPGQGKYKIRYFLKPDWKTAAIAERCFRELKKSSASKYSTMELSFNPSMISERERMAQQAEVNVKDNFNSMDLEKSYDSLFEVLWYTQLPCFDVKGVTSKKKDEFGLLKACIWKGVRIPCALIFKTSPTDQGMCCTFNIEAADMMFQEGPYQEMLKKMEEKDMKYRFDSTKKLPDWWISNGEPKSQPGKSKGLTLILDAHSDKVASSSITEDVDGFFAIVGSPNQFPMTTIQSILIRPGHNNLIALKATKVSPEGDIRAIATKHERNCIFGDEVQLKLHSTYSQRNCMLEKSMEYVMTTYMNKTDPCTPWYFPRTQRSSRICDPFEAYQFSTEMQNVPSIVMKECLPNCDGTDYSATVTAAPFRRCDHKTLGLSALCNFNETINPPIWGQSVIDEYNEEKGEVPHYVADKYSSNLRDFTKPDASEVFTILNRKQSNYDAYKKDIGMVNFFFEATTAYEFIRVPKMTWTDFVSQVGGMLGLCMGLSLVSIFEVIYWFVWNAAKIFHQ
jgi:hypothetical protein